VVSRAARRGVRACASLKVADGYDFVLGPELPMPMAWLALLRLACLDLAIDPKSQKSSTSK
jgi:hypothetical protein